MVIDIDRDRFDAHQTRMREGIDLLASANAIVTNAKDENVLDGQQQTAALIGIGYLLADIAASLAIMSGKMK